MFFTILQNLKSYLIKLKSRKKILLILFILVNVNLQSMNAQVNYYIQEKACCNIDGTKICCGGIGRGKYIIPGKNEKKGLTARLYIKGKDALVVGAGSQLIINQKNYVVLKITNNNIFRKYGKVTICEVQED